MKASQQECAQFKWGTEDYDSREIALMLEVPFPSCIINIAEF